MKKTAHWLFLIVLLSCISAVASENRTVTVTDMAGRKVTAPFDPQRIVCIGPGALRLIVYLQAENKVSGVEDVEKRTHQGIPYRIAHPELSKLPRCGTGGPVAINKKPDLEAVLSVNPEVLFITYMDGQLADEIQRTLQIPVVVLISYGDFATSDKTFHDAMSIAGKILNRERRSDEVVKYIESLRENLNSRVVGLDDTTGPTVFVGGVGFRGVHGIESTERSYVPFQWIGVDNVAEKVEAVIGNHVFMDKETLLGLNPDVIFIDGGGLAMVEEDFKKRPEYYRALKAFSEGRVYTLLPSIPMRPIWTRPWPMLMPLERPFFRKILKMSIRKKRPMKSTRFWSEARYTKA